MTRSSEGSAGSSTAPEPKSQTKPSPPSVHAAKEEKHGLTHELEEPLAGAEPVPALQAIGKRGPRGLHVLAGQSDWSQRETSIDPHSTLAAAPSATESSELAVPAAQPGALAEEPSAAVYDPASPLPVPTAIEASHSTMKSHASPCTAAERSEAETTDRDQAAEAGSAASASHAAVAGPPAAPPAAPPMAVAPVTHFHVQRSAQEHEALIAKWDEIRKSLLQAAETRPGPIPVFAPGSDLEREWLSTGYNLLKGLRLGYQGLQLVSYGPPGPPHQTAVDNVSAELFDLFHPDPRMRVRESKLVYLKDIVRKTFPDIDLSSRVQGKYHQVLIVEVEHHHRTGGSICSHMRRFFELPYVSCVMTIHADEDPTGFHGCHVMMRSDQNHFTNDHWLPEELPRWEEYGDEFVIDVPVSRSLPSDIQLSDEALDALRSPRLNKMKLTYLVWHGIMNPREQ